ncbi:MAG: HAD-IIIA family hydrolase, partial [Gemmatimonadota bacterium]
DRDGTIIRNAHYLADPEGVVLLPNAAQGLRKLRSLGLKLVILSNQSGIGRGMFDRRQLDLVHGRLESLLRKESIELDGAYYCPHAPGDDCDCRKPGVGLARQAAEALGLDLHRSVVVGDGQGDIDLGRALGVPAIGVVTQGDGAVTEKLRGADYVVADLLEAAVIIERISGA